MSETIALLRTFLARTTRATRGHRSTREAMYGADLAARRTADTFRRDNASVGEPEE